MVLTQNLEQSLENRRVYVLGVDTEFITVPVYMHIP